jgi:hypothetical protein
VGLRKTKFYRDQCCGGGYLGALRTPGIAEAGIRG